MPKTSVVKIRWLGGDQGDRVLGITLPRKMLADLEWAEGDYVRVSQNKDTVKVTKIDE